MNTTQDMIKTKQYQYQKRENKKRKEKKRKNKCIYKIVVEEEGKKKY